MKAPELPLWASVLTAMCVVVGASFCLIGAIGLVRFRSFYERVHAPTLGTTLGAGLILLGSMICASVLQARFVAHEILIAASILVTTPVTFILLVRAALFRDRAEGSRAVPPLE